MTYRLPALSKAISQGLYNPEAKILCRPSQVNLKISPPWASLPDTNRLCADALEQIKITAPTQANLLNNRPAIRRAALDLVSVSLVFMVVPLFWFSWVYFSFHRGNA